MASVHHMAQEMQDSDFITKEMIDISCLRLHSRHFVAATV